MERKRKLPPRAAARQEQAAKRRNVETRGQSSTPAVVETPPREPTPPPRLPTPPPPLPKHVEAGKPLPTVEEPQAADLSSKEYQSLSESGVMSESLSRSRHKWLSDGLFEKFWTKPHKRKGMLQEDPNNPPKDSMMKVGLVNMTIGPHIVEATMFAVKTFKLLPHQQLKFHPKPQPLQQPPGQAQTASAAQGPPETAQETAQAPAQAPAQAARVQQPSHTSPQTHRQPQPQLQAPEQLGTKPVQQPTPVLARPVLQYGPPNGAMPPPSTQSAPTATCTPAIPVAAPAPAPAPDTSQPTSTEAKPAVRVNDAPEAPTKPATTTPQTALLATEIPAAAPGASPAVSVASAKAMTSPSPAFTVKAQPSPSPSPAPAPPAQTQPQPQHLQPKALSSATPRAVQPAPDPVTSTSNPQRAASPAHPALQPTAVTQLVARPPSNLPLKPGSVPVSTGTPPQKTNFRPPSAPNPCPPSRVNKAGAPSVPAAKPAANDPVIALLAQKASRDPELRELMKRVAEGKAKEGELAKFQKIIDQLNAEYKQKGGQQGLSADRLLVDGRTVKYFADEVRTILDIVLASNPNQKSSELRPPPRSDPLVVLLVKTALEDRRSQDMIRRIAEGKHGATDATDLKQILDRLHRDAKTTPKTPAPGPLPATRRQATHGHSGVAAAPPAKPNASQNAPNGNPQALRSKGPPPAANRPDISAVAFDFGSGDRYLFPKYSVLEFLPSQAGQQVVASFLIVRKGSISEYGGDPKLDYYQPVTIRLQTNTGRHLENLARVVAPQEEVRRYMNDVMDNMTRAEYVLLAMRLPRVDFDPEKAVPGVDDCKANSPTPKSEPETEQSCTPKPGVLWTTGPGGKDANPSLSVKFQDPEQEAQTKYERLIRSVAEKEVDSV
ncbi:hypothetical protein UVI_02017800 [Ustilaginoidea virens]|uniref:SWR1-complex protein 3 domain-containing protein n=1 Tax=Ustilaginoidea virens TaxID=1159556 RepID=A0A1B5KS54_USTVR|nr:hypothetical protein UVI_02017800 [Ustilaginoidea virens]